MNKFFITTFLISISLPSLAEDPTSFLRQLVEIDSGTNQVRNVNKIQDHVEQRLKNLGFQIERQTDPTKLSGDMIVGTLRGKEEKTITLIVHSDTVFEPESKFSGFRLSEDEKIGFGPGVIDNKGGIVVMLNGLAGYLAKHPSPRYSLRVLSSPSEEVGSTAYVKNFKAYGEDSDLVLSFEPSLDDGSVVTARRGNRWFHFKTIGKEAHAGRAFRDGVNACVEMSKLAGEIAGLTNFHKNLTLNVGHIRGGQDKYNIVCGTAELKVDTRFSSVRVRNEMQKNIDRIVENSNQRQSKNGIHIATNYAVVDDSPPYSPEKKTADLLKIYLKHISALEQRTVVAKDSGASADANYLARPGLVILDGLGPSGAQMHTPEESIVLSSLETRAQAFINFMAELEKIGI